MDAVTQGTFVFIETTKSYALIAVRLHSIKQYKSIAVLKEIWRPYATLILGQFKGALLSSPLLLKEHLGRCGIKMSYEESRNLLRFIERLVRTTKEEFHL